MIVPEPWAHGKPDMSRERVRRGVAHMTSCIVARDEAARAAVHSASPRQPTRERGSSIMWPSWDLSLPLRDVALRMALAVIIGALIGLERQARHKPAGPRTMMLVALGSALFILATDEVVASLAGAEKASVLGRAVAGVITGVGFLGAGTIMRESGRVAGVTTAAAVWVTAGIGVACGLGELVLATLFGGAALVTLLIARRFEGDERVNSHVK